MARLVDIDLLLKRFQEELNWNRPPHSGPMYDFDKFRYEMLLEAEEFLQQIAEETPDLTLVPVARECEVTPTQEREAEQVEAMLAATHPIVGADESAEEDALYDAARRISERDGLDWEQSRSLIFQRAAHELAAAKALKIDCLQAACDETTELLDAQTEQSISLATALHKAKEERDALAATVNTQAEALRWFNLPLSECGYDFEYWYQRAQRGRRAVLAAEGRFEDYTPVTPLDESQPDRRKQMLELAADCASYRSALAEILDLDGSEGTEAALLDDAVRDMLDIASGWCRPMSDAEKLEMIQGLGNDCLQLTSDMRHSLATRTPGRIAEEALGFPFTSRTPDKPTTESGERS